ncbi:MAG: hypothetical protein K6T83_15660 [Alicyclobacillus sp.]|nr:hypothetical protein [Alicyclobacillus sp.]
MRSGRLLPQVLSLLAAAVLVTTAVYVYTLWRNQSPDRVLGLGANQLIYKTPDMAIGVSNRDSLSRNATLLRFTTDGGWVIAGTGKWLFPPNVTRHVWIALIPDQTGPAGGYWFCAVQRDREIQAIEIIDHAHPANTATYTFHHGGVIEPIIGSSPLVIRGIAHHKTAFSEVWMPDN